jgi:hypothetical protein
MGLRGTSVTYLLFFGWLALEINVRLGAEKELRLYHPYRVAFIFVDFGYEDITRTGLGKMQNCLLLCSFLIFLLCRRCV